VILEIARSMIEKIVSDMIGKIFFYLLTHKILAIRRLFIVRTNRWKWIVISY